LWLRDWRAGWSCGDGVNQRYWQLWYYLLESLGLPIALVKLLPRPADPDHLDHIVFLNRFIGAIEDDIAATLEEVPAVGGVHAADVPSPATGRQTTPHSVTDSLGQHCRNSGI
jgi:hypothetical protein